MENSRKKSWAKLWVFTASIHYLSDANSNLEKDDFTLVARDAFGIMSVS